MQKLTKCNLEKDNHVQGKKWLSTNSGYFNSKKVFSAFLDALKKIENALLEKVLIADLGAGIGNLGELIKKHLESRGFKVILYLIDASQKQLNANKNQDTIKIIQDLEEFNLPVKFDLIIMRSVLHYFANTKRQLKDLKKIKAHLNKNGFFINQAHCLSNKTEANIMQKMYCNKKFGKRKFSTEKVL